MTKNGTRVKKWSNWHP